MTEKKVYDLGFAVLRCTKFVVVDQNNNVVGQQNQIEIMEPAVCEEEFYIPSSSISIHGKDVTNLKNALNDFFPNKERAKA